MLKVLVRSAGVCVAVSILYMVVRLFGGTENPQWIQLSMVVSLALLPIFFLRLQNMGWDRETSLLFLLMLAGMIMRIGYFLYTPCTVRQHDLWEFNTESGGHASYILTIMQRGSLPDGNKRQFYQQPFFYLLGSAVSWVVNHILRSDAPDSLADAARIVSCTASCLTIPASDALCRICDVGKKGRVTAAAVVAFSPVFYMTGGFLGPDALSTLFLVLAVLYTIKWHRKPSWRHTLLLALIYGFGVMTKISVAVVALFTLAVFVRHFIVAWQREKWRGLLKKYCVFGVISLPLGLWFCIRNYVRFGQAFGYVLDLGGELHEQYTGGYSLVQRIASVSWENIIESPYVSVTEDYNAPVYYLKSSVFGEYTFDIPGFLSALLLYAAIAMAAICMTAFVWQIIQGRKNRREYIIPVIALLFYAGVTVFYLKYPYGCSMDYRYMGLLSVLGALMLGNFQEKSKWQWLKKRNYDTGVLCCYCGASVLFYLFVP